MPSSLIFAALAAAWLVVLVPMFARRRQEVSRTTDTALAARVVRRGSDRPSTDVGTSTTDRQEEFEMPDTDHDGAGARERAGLAADLDDQEQGDDSWRRVYSDDVRAGRRYRPGRGGFDPEAAALAARAKYVRRQRIVIGIILVAVSTGVLAGLLWSAMWWIHGISDAVLVGYLTYLRRQVRIEEDVRSRRLARLSGSSDFGEESEEGEAGETEAGQADEPDGISETEEPFDTRWDSREAPPARPAGTVIELDDEDPMFDELDERTWEPYRRASGE